MVQRGFMKIYLATDHAGYDLKEKVKTFLQGLEYDVEDCGVHEMNPDDDYPDFIAKAARKVSEFPTDRAIIFGGSGQGEAMLANKFRYVRTALFYGPEVPTSTADVTGRVSSDPYEMLRLTREHNDANVLSIGARFVTDEEVFTAIKLWLETPFSQSQRHARRLKKIQNIEDELHEQNS